MITIDNTTDETVVAEETITETTEDTTITETETETTEEASESTETEETETTEETAEAETEETTIVQYSLDMLTENSVSLLKKTFVKTPTGELEQVGYNERRAYSNKKTDRETLQELLPEDKYQALIAVWGDDPTISEPTDEELLADRKIALIARMSRKCNTVITSGFDMELEDGNTYHFSLETTDQLKIQALALKAMQGETVLPYHADGEECRFFSVNEILSLNSKMEEIITYQTTYYNSLRSYIQAITTLAEVANVRYGMDIPEEYQSDVLKELLVSASEATSETETDETVDEESSAT